MQAPAQSIAIFSMETTYTVIFDHKSKSNTSFVTVKGLLLFVCTHNVNKTFYKIYQIHVGHLQSILSTPGNISIINSESKHCKKYLKCLNIFKTVILNDQI